MEKRSSLSRLSLSDEGKRFYAIRSSLTDSEQKLSMAEEALRKSRTSFSQTHSNDEAYPQRKLRYSIFEAQGREASLKGKAQYS
jgi:hypothetical protein